MSESAKSLVRTAHHTLRLALPRSTCSACTRPAIHPLPPHIPEGPLPAPRSGQEPEAVPAVQEVAPSGTETQPQSRGLSFLDPMTPGQTSSPVFTKLMGGSPPHTGSLMLTLPAATSLTSAEAPPHLPSLLGAKNQQSWVCGSCMIIKAAPTCGIVLGCGRRQPWIH